MYFYSYIFVYKSIWFVFPLLLILFISLGSYKKKKQCTVNAIFNGRVLTTERHLIFIIKKHANTQHNIQKIDDNKIKTHIQQNRGYRQILRERLICKPK